VGVASTKLLALGFEFEFRCKLPIVRNGRHHARLERA
jgi:hypothetical protein